MAAKPVIIYREDLSAPEAAHLIDEIGMLAYLALPLAPSDAPTSVGGKPLCRDTMTLAERNAYAQEHGFAALALLPQHPPLTGMGYHRSLMSPEEASGYIAEHGMSNYLLLPQ